MKNIKLRSEAKNEEIEKSSEETVKEFSSGTAMRKENNRRFDLCEKVD